MRGPARSRHILRSSPSKGSSVPTSQAYAARLRRSWGGLRSSMHFLRTCYLGGEYGSRERRRHDSEPPLRVAGEHDDRDRQNQRQPELVAEHRDRVVVALVARTQNRKYLCASGSTSAGSLVRRCPSARTSYVSGFTVIR